MQRNKTIGMLLILSMSLSVLFALPTHAVTYAELDPITGTTGTEVRLTGTIDTLGGAYTILFDVDDDGNAETTVETGSAPASSYVVNTTFVVPSCVGTDAGRDHKVTLKDDSSGNTHNATFRVETSREIAVPEYAQEGDPVTMNMSVTGGLANTVNNFTVIVTDPAGTETKNYNVSFTTDANGFGYNITDFPADFSTGASTNFTGTYTIVANRTLPGAITDAAAASFDIGLTDALTYERFDTVNVKTSGWVTQQNITVTIKDPSMQNVSVWDEVNATDGTWTGTWMIPWNAPVGTYTVEAVNATGDDKAVVSIQTFTVGSVALTATFKTDPVSQLQRTETATAKFTIQYPDSSYYDNETSFDAITVSVYYNTTLVDTIALSAEDYGADNNWTVSWDIPWDAVLGIGYKFSLDAGSITDVDGNTGPESDVSSDTFEVLKTELNVAAINTDESSYMLGEVVTVYFTATYQNGDPVTTGSAAINLTMANGTDTQLTAVYVSANSRFEAKYTLKTGDPLGTWYALLEAQGLKDDADNMGPNSDRSTDFTVTEGTPSQSVTAEVKITPRTLNLKSNGRWVTVHIELSEGYSAEDIDVSTILLDDVVAPETTQVSEEGKLVAKFSRADVVAHIQDTYGISGSKFSDVTLTITGEVSATTFQDSDTIRVKN
jgi:hypothetical protein